MMRAMAQPEFECGNRRKVLQIMEPMSLLARVLVGAIAGRLASKAVKSDLWLIFDAVAGMTGALVSGFLFNVFGRSGATDFNLWSIFVAFLGAVTLLLLTHTGKRAPPGFSPINNDNM